MSKTVLITLPHPIFNGGVGHIYKVLKLNEQEHIEYFYNTQANRSANPVFFFSMVFRFIYQIQGKKIVHLNPSLDAKAVIRDGILLLISKIFHKKVIIFFHGWDEKFEKTLKKSSLQKKMFQIAFSKSDVFLLLGNVFADKLNELGVKRTETYFIPTVADNSYLNETLKKGYRNTEIQTFHLLFMAGFVSTKGMDIVLQTLNYLNQNQRVYKFELVMAGVGPDLNKCKQFAIDQNLHNVTFSGYVSGLEKHECFNKADILFFPSLTEGLPCVIMEAMLYGLAVVTRPIGGIPHWVKHNINGWLSDSVDPIVFANGILSLVRQPELLAKIKDCNQDIALNNFTPEKIKRQIQNIYNKILYDDQN